MFQVIKGNGRELENTTETKGSSSYTNNGLMCMVQEKDEVEKAGLLNLLCVLKYLLVPCH